MVAEEDVYYSKSAQEPVTRVRVCNSNRKPIVRVKLLNHTKNRTLVTCTLSNNNILRSLRSVLLFLVLAGNSTLFQFLRSYTLLL